MQVLTSHRAENLPLIFGVVVLSLLVGMAAGTGWVRPLLSAAALALFVILVKDIRLVTPVLILLIPLSIKFSMGFGNVHLATAVLIVALVAWFWRSPLLEAPFSFPRSPVLVSLAVLGGVLGLSALQIFPYLLGDSTQFLRMIEFFLYSALFALVLQIDFSATEIRMLLVLTLLVGVAQGLVGLNQWLTRPGLFLTGTFDGQHNNFAIFVVFITLLLLGVVLEAGRLKTGLAAFVGLGVTLFAVVFSFSRGGYAALAAGIPVFFFTPVRARRKIALAVGAAILFAVVYVSAPEHVRERAYSLIVNVTGERTEISFGRRLYMWRRGITDFFQHPILGKGAWGQGMKDNYYFKMLSEAGVLGFIAFLGLLYTVLHEEWKIVKRGPDNDLVRGVATGLFAASFACLVVYNLSGDFFGVHSFMGIFWIVLALVLKYGSTMRPAGVNDGV